MRGPITGPSNNGLERTRRVGVPAARAVIRVSPRRSTRCSTDPLLSERDGSKGLGNQLS